MKKNIPFSILIFVLLSVYCSHNKNANRNIESNSLELHFPESGEDTLKASYFADTVIYITLETTKESYIQHINQLWMDESVILISSFNSGLIMFGQNGNFIRQIGKNGRGPGEYLSILHFDVIKDTIYISSTGKRGFLRYTFDGTFCDEINLNYQPAYFSSTIDQKLACYEHAEGKVYVYNKNLYQPPDTITVEYGVTIGRHRWIQVLNSGYNYLQKTTTGLLFNSFLSDTVWNIVGDKKEPAFILNMRDKLLPYDKQIEFSNGDFEGFNQMANPYNFVHLIPFSSLIFIFQLHHTIYANDSGYDAIHLLNTKTGEIRKFSTNYIYEDILSKIKLSNERLEFFYPIYSPDYLVTSKNPIDVLNYFDQNKRNGIEIPSQSWINQMKTLKEDDNPIIVKIKIKKN